MIKQRYEIDGRFWLRIPYAAKLAGVSVASIRKMMGAGSLDWCQLRTGSKTFLVDEQAIISIRLERH
ncbi:hypothetical protein [Sphingomonas sp. 28-63-12]|uniref:hypothetical protein n=1 Tax=Sphingomonas sp. 28-63-12 TaxID=1970434 RepID=UPI000BDD170F|nr:MAG: hypothetical protein B7Y47_05960 [Sphingomonas sp. 28-63-12]